MFAHITVCASLTFGHKRGPITWEPVISGYFAFGGTSSVQTSLAILPVTVIEVDVLASEKHTVHVTLGVDMYSSECLVS